MSAMANWGEGGQVYSEKCGLVRFVTTYERHILLGILYIRAVPVACGILGPNTRVDDRFSRQKA